MLSPVLKSNELHTPFFHNSPLPCFLLQDHNGTIVTANAAAAAFFNTTPTCLETLSISDLVHPEEHTSLCDLLKKCSSQQPPLTLGFKTGNNTTLAQVFVSRSTEDEALLGVML